MTNCKYTHNDNNFRTDGSRSKRIAFNSLFLFIRFAVIMVLNLYAVRYVLKGLGQEDYGVYSAVASVVQTSACVIPVLSLSIQRFYSFSLGKGDMYAMAGIFTASMNILLVVVISLFVFFELTGVYFIDHLTIPAHRMDTAMVVFQLSLVSFIFSLLQIPFVASIYAHEDMGVYTMISAIECVLKFAVAYLISQSPIENLTFYCIGLLCVAVMVFIAYSVYSFTKYKECRYRCSSTSHQLYKELFSFSGWTFFGALAGTGMIQGSIILLNVFFGPLVNASFAIAINVYNAFISITNSVAVAFRPAMIKSYAEQKFDYLSRLFSISNRALLYLLLSVSVTLMFEMPTVLRLWLDECDDEKVLFCRMIVAFSCIMAMHNPITAIVQASGNIKRYTLLVESVTLMVVPVAWVAFKLGAPSYVMIVIMTMLCGIAHVIRLYCLKSVYDYSIIHYLHHILFPAAVVLVLLSGYAFAVTNIIDEGVARASLLLVSVPVMMLPLMLVLALEKEEREQMMNFVRKVLNKK